MKSPYDAAAHLKQVHDSICHERHGIITSLVELNESRIAEGLYVFHAGIVNALYFRENGQVKAQSTRAGSGVNFTRSSALWSTIGEAIERYSGSIYYPDSFVCASGDDLGGAALDLKSLILFSEDQYHRENFPFAPPDSSVNRYWTEAFDAATGARRWVPVELVYLAPAMLNKSKELGQNSSSGLACGQSVEMATLSGLCEVIERDAFSAMWQLSYSPARLVLDEATEERLTPGVRQYLKTGPLKILLWSLVTDIGIPVVMAMAECPTQGVFGVGASCRLDPAEAIDKAIMEALHSFVWAQKKLDSGDTPPELSEVNSPETHMSYWLDPTRRAMAEFLFADSCPIRTSNLPSKITTLEQLIARLRDLGHSVLVADITPADVGSLNLHVVRAIVPGLHPLIFGPHLVSEDPRRLRQLAQFWEIPFPAFYNPLPHPFP